MHHLIFLLTTDVSLKISWQKLSKIYEKKMMEPMVIQHTGPQEWM